MLDTYQRIHLIGIAGSGMRAIAHVLIEKGFIVSGSDIQESAITEKFRNAGATIFMGHDAAHVDGVDVVIRSTAIHDDNPEIVGARERNIPILHRSDVVKAVLDETYGIAVAGAHGKTTTTSMIGQIFMEANQDPTIIIGGEVDYLNGSSHVGKGKYSIAEADESDGSFLHLNPKRIVITNIENDHMDHYRTVENLLRAFTEFSMKLPEDGIAVVCGDNPSIRRIMPDIKRTCITYGLGVGNEYRIDNLRIEQGITTFEVVHNDTVLGTLRLAVPGQHNALNALGALVVALGEGISFEVVAQALRKFIGAKRRFETKGHVKDVWVVDDYAHHPTEIAATIKAAKSLEDHRVVILFQPHRYSRTKLLLREFGTAFKEADLVFITDIYSAGEKPEAGIDGMSIPLIIKELTGKEIHYVADVNDLPETVLEYIEPNDLVITMGAGNINQFGPKLLALLEEK